MSDTGTDPTFDEFEYLLERLRTVAARIQEIEPILLKKDKKKTLNLKKYWGRE